MKTGEFWVNHGKEDRQNSLESAIKKNTFQKSAIYTCNSILYKELKAFPRKKYDQKVRSIIFWERAINMYPYSILVIAQ
jgi:hypothetical protein